MLPDAGLNPPANHTVHEVVHIPGRNGSLPSVALIVLAAGHPVPRWASGEPGLAAAASMRRDLERRNGRRALVGADPVPCQAMSHQPEDGTTRQMKWTLFWVALIAVSLVIWLMLSGL